MADKVIALVGPGTGPLIHTSRMGQLLVSFRELTSGEAKLETDDGWRVITSVDSEWEVPEAFTIQVSYAGKSKKFTCIVRSRPNALPGN